MSNAGYSFKSNTNVISMQKDGCSVISNETHDEKDTPQNKENLQLKRSTPILFSTNRGLHLRMANATTAPTPQPTSSMSTNNKGLSIVNSTYSTIFCDLERWSTNRANTIRLEDTFTISKPAVSSGSLVSTNLRFLPHKSLSVRFNGYSRFDVE